MRAKNCYPVVRFSGTPYRLVPSQKSTGCVVLTDRGVMITVVGLIDYTALIILMLLFVIRIIIVP